MVDYTVFSIPTLAGLTKHYGVNKPSFKSNVKWKCAVNILMQIVNKKQTHAIPLAVARCNYITKKSQKELTFKIQNV